MLYLYNTAADDLSSAIAEAFGSEPLCRESFIERLHPFLHRASTSRRDPQMLVFGDASGGYALLGAVYGFEVRWFPLSERAIKRPDANMGDGSLEVLSRSVTTDEPPADVVIIHPENERFLRTFPVSAAVKYVRPGGLLCLEESAHLRSTAPDRQPAQSFHASGFNWRRARNEKAYRLQRAVDAFGRILPFLAVKRSLKIYDSF